MNRITEDPSVPVEGKRGERTHDATNVFTTSTDFSNQTQVDSKVEANECKVETAPLKQNWKKPSDMPKRPMSSYNLFYRMERERLVNGGQPRLYTTADINIFVINQNLKDECPKPKRKHRKTHGMISFTDLARVIAINWKNMDEEAKVPFRDRAVIEKEAYTAKIEAWNKTKPAVGGTKRKATPSRAPKPNKPQKTESSLVDCNDSMYEFYSVAQPPHLLDGVVVCCKPTGQTEEPPINATRTELYDSATLSNRPTEQFAYARIFPTGTMDSTYSQDDFLSGIGTLNHSRSLSDITDSEQLTAINPSKTGQQNHSSQHQEQGFQTFDESSGNILVDGFDRKQSATDAHLPLDDFHQPELSNTQGFLYGAMIDRAQGNPTQTMVDVASHQMIDHAFLNRFTSQSASYIPEPMPQYAHGQQFNAPIVEQEHLRNNESTSIQHRLDFATSIPQFIGSRELVHEQASHLFPTTRQSNIQNENCIRMLPTALNQSSTSRQNIYDLQALHDRQIVLNEYSTGIPYHQQLFSYPTRPADFVTTSQGVQHDYVVQPNLIDTSTQSQQPAFLLPFHYLQQPNHNHIINEQHAIRRVSQPYYHEQAIQFSQQSSDNNVIMPQSVARGQQYAQTGNTISYNYITNNRIPIEQTTGIPYVLQSSDNNVITQSGAIGQQYAPRGNSNNYNYIGNNTTQQTSVGYNVSQYQQQQLHPQQQQQQRGDYHDGQSGDESHHWEY